MQLLSSVLNWLAHDWNIRRQRATALLKKLRLGVVPQESLTKNLDFAEGNGMTECCEVLNWVLELHVDSDAKSSSAASDSCEQEWFTPRGVIKVRKL